MVGEKKMRRAEEETKNSIIGNGNNYAGSRWKNVTIGIPPEALHTEFEQFQRKIFSGIEAHDERLVKRANQYLLSKFEEIDAKISQKQCKEASPDPLSVSEACLREEIRNSQDRIVNEIRDIIGDTASTVDDKIFLLQQSNEKIQSGINRIYGYCEETFALIKKVEEKLVGLGLEQAEAKDILKSYIDKSEERHEELKRLFKNQFDLELEIQAQQCFDSDLLAAIFNEIRELGNRCTLTPLISGNEVKIIFKEEVKKSIEKAMSDVRLLWGNGFIPVEMRLYRKTDLSSPNPCPFCGTEYSIHFETDGRCSCGACGQEFSNLRSDLSDEDLSYIRGELRDLCPTQDKLASWRNGHTAKLEPIDGQAGHYRMSFEKDTQMEMRTHTNCALVILPISDIYNNPVHDIKQFKYEEPWDTLLYTINTLIVNKGISNLGSGNNPLLNWAGLKKIVVPDKWTAIRVFGSLSYKLEDGTIQVYPSQYKGTIIRSTSQRR